MNKLLSFIKLDFITIKPYLTIKNLIIILIVTASFSFNDNGNGIIIGFIMAFTFTISSYNFAVGEKNGIDSLYAVLPIKRDTVVLGRYIFTFIFDVCTGIIACAVTFALQSIKQNDFNLQETLFTALVMLVVYCFFQAIQFPIYFKLGYAKAKLLAYLPFVVFPAIVLSATAFFKDNMMTALIGSFTWVIENPILTSIFCMFLLLMFITVSYTISLGFYRKRSF